MSDTTLKMDLDPKKVIESLQQMAKQSEELSKQIEAALGKDAPKQVKRFEDASENGASKISTIFRNLGNRIKEDMKTAFSLGAVMEGMNIAKDIGAAVPQIMDMDRAFDRLNTRLGLSADKLLSFKKGISETVAGTGQKLDEIMPGLEAVSSRGGVTDPGQLTAISQALGQAKGITGEDITALSESITDTITGRGDKVTADSFKKTLDAVQSARVAGQFGSAGEAAAFLKDIAPSMKTSGLSTREAAAFAATGSKSGERGLHVLEQLMEQGQTQVGREKLNAILGRNIFDKNGKMSAEELGKVDTGRFGMMSESVLQEATGISGASGTDLTKLVKSFKENMGAFDKVSKGANETSAQFEIATDNFISKFDKFKEGLKSSVLQVGSDLSRSLNDFIKGDFSGGIKHVGDAFSDVMKNKGQLAAGAGALAAGAVITGGAMGSLLKKIPGIGGVASGIAGGAAAEAMGIQQVYVTNMPTDFGGMAGAAGGIGGKLGKFAGNLGLVGLAASAGVGIGEMINNNPTASKAIDSMFDKISGVTEDTKTSVAFAEWDAMNKSYAHSKASGGMAAGMTFEQYVKAIEQGTKNAHQQTKGQVQYTNPSDIKGRGGKR